MDEARKRLSREIFLSEFGGLPHGDTWVLDRLARLLEEEHVRAGEVLYRPGDPPEFLYFMGEGRVSLQRPDAHDRTFEGRSVFGLFDLVLDRPRARKATALSDLSVMKVRAEAWFELMDDSFRLTQAVVLRLARRVADLEQRIVASDPWGLVDPRHNGFLSRPLNVLERLAALLDEPLLRGAGVQTLSDLALVSEEFAFDAGQRVFERGVSREHMFVVLEGEIDVSRVAPDVVRRSALGQIVGGAAAFGEPALAWEGHARTPTRALAFRVEDWFDLMEEHFDMVRATLGALAVRSEELRERSSPDQRSKF
jgi:CRP-like cAMP-binding protein